MSEKKNIDDGGPAFPRHASEFTKNGSCLDGNRPSEEQDGISARDYFAAKAMQGMWMPGVTLWPKDNVIPNVSDGKKTPNWIRREEALETMAKDSYELADAMIKARKK